MYSVTILNSSLSSYLSLSNFGFVIGKTTFLCFNCYYSDSFFFGCFYDKKIDDCVSRASKSLFLISDDFLSILEMSHF